HYKVFDKKDFLGEREIVIRTIEQEDQFVFSKFTRETTKAATIPMYLVFQNQSTYDFFEIAQEIEQDHDRVFGIDHTTNVKGLYTMGENEDYHDVFISQNY